MNIDEAAKYLFVSRAHVKRLLERRDITATQDTQGGYVIDAESVEKYAKQLESARRAYSDSQNEDNDQLEL